MFVADSADYIKAAPIEHVPRPQYPRCIYSPLQMTSSLALRLAGHQNPLGSNRDHQRAGRKCPSCDCPHDHIPDCSAV